MNIVAASNASPSTDTGRADAATGVGSLDAASGDPSIPSGTDGQGFGQILSDSLAKGRAPIGDTAGEPLAAQVATDPLRLADRRGPADPTAITGPLTATPKKDGSDPGQSSPVDADDRPDDAIGTDLSSQIALVSQWAALAPVPATTGVSTRPGDPAAGDPSATVIRERDAKVGGARSGDAKSIRDGAPGIGVAAAVDGARLQPPIDAVQAAAFALAAAARAPASSNRGAGSVASQGARPGEVAPLEAGDGRTDAIDKLFALAGGTVSTTAIDPASMASQFVAQVSAQVSNAQSAAGLVATASSAGLREPVGSAAWSHELGQTAIRMATNDLQNTSLRLNPEHLGPLDVQMRIDNGVAHLQFAAAHAETRHALESSRTTLDQMFGEQGLKLGDWSVGSSSSNGSFARFGAGSPPAGDARATSGDVDPHADEVVVAQVAIRPLGLVDTFA